MKTLTDKLVELGHTPELRRGKIFVDGMPVHRIISGLPINFTRRRYGVASFFCWVEAYKNGKWHLLGDPWPKVTPSTAEIEAEIHKHTTSPTNC